MIAEDVNLKSLSPHCFVLHQVPAMYNIIEACRFEKIFGGVDAALGPGGARAVWMICHVEAYAKSLPSASTGKGFRPESLST